MFFKNNKKITVAEALDIARETYFAILLDRSFDGPVRLLFHFVC
jgi:hypothetical protein